LIEVCIENGLIPSNLDAARKYGLTEQKIVLSNTLENSIQKNAYERYLSSIEGSRYLFADPATGACTLPLGPGNAPIVEVSSPIAGQAVTRGKNLEISGNVRYLESITEFKVKFDASDIAGASLNADGSYVVNYFVPAGTTLGSHTVTISAKDNYGKSDVKTINITVVDSTSSIVVSVASPANGVTISFPPEGVTLLASVSGGSVDEVTFSISKVGGGYTKSLTDSNGSDGWAVSWVKDASVTNGQYKISVSAKSGGSTIAGNSVTVTF
jgi:hypothetical protein